ncbi:hypothetical protein AB0F81_41255 [Actinoplanes sp. NPDC024001]
MLTDLLGTGKSVVLAMLMFAGLTAAGVAAALLVATLLNALGFDPSSMY